MSAFHETQGLNITDHGNPDNKLGSPCTSTFHRRGNMETGFNFNPCMQEQN
jgi:hypothetical protein